MTDDSRPTPPPLLDELTPEVRIEMPRAWLWLAALVFVLAVLVASFAAWQKPTRPDFAHELEEIVSGGNKAEGKATLAAYRAQWNELESAVSAGKTAAEAGAQAWLEHQRDLHELLDSDEGRRIAADPALVQQYQALADLSSSSAQITAQQAASAAGLFEAIQEASSQEVMLKPPSQETSAAATSFRQVAETELAQVRQWRSQLASLRSTARSTAAGGRLLRDVLAERETAERSRVNAEIAAHWKKRQAELADERIAAELAEKERIQRATDGQAVRALREQADQEEAKRAEQARQADAAARHRARLAAFRQELPAMRSYLTPFITPGKMQLGKYGWESGADAGPISWAALQSLLGAPGDHRTATIFANTFGELDTKNDRPFGSFPSRYQPDNDRAAMERLIEFLRANGDLMVEEKLLRP